MWLLILTVQTEECFHHNASLLGIEQNTVIRLRLSPVQNSIYCNNLNGSQTTVVVKYDCEMQTLTSQPFIFNISEDVQVDITIDKILFELVEECDAAQYTINMGSTTITGTIQQIQTKITDITQCWANIVFNYSYSISQDEYFNISVTPQNCQIDSGAIPYLEFDNGDQIFTSLIIMPKTLPNHYQSNFNFGQTNFFYSSMSMYSSDDQYVFSNLISQFQQKRSINMRLKLISLVNSVTQAYYGNIENIYGLYSEMIGEVKVKQSESNSILDINTLLLLQNAPQSTQIIQFDLIISNIQCRQSYSLQQVKNEIRKIFPKQQGSIFTVFITLLDNQNNTIKEFVHTCHIQSNDIYDGIVKLYKDKICVTTKIKEDSVSKQSSTTILSLAVQTSYDTIQTYFQFQFNYILSNQTICFYQQNKSDSIKIGSFRQRVNLFIKAFTQAQPIQRYATIENNFEFFFFNTVVSEDYSSTLIWIVIINFGILLISSVLVGCYLYKIRNTKLIPPNTSGQIDDIVSQQIIPNTHYEQHTTLALQSNQYIDQIEDSNK
ncbi:Conserved_hypothetical protein [Hexamita inflata]|uniref:Transmembrane protein n=1 Tax=Hexamita inflata TaxID=28002 RepID=A0AA86TMR0_9EUKA|nr:Conserved hypothetical protein [Hexamita inflata]